ncbi:MAG TPA: hypothetical protein PLP88_03210 [Bacteroidales bacterium]|nr:hypothetical protein [Bacteroidales bacterium]
MTIKKLLMLCLALLLSCGAFSQKQARTPEQIRKEMAAVRENTDWGDEAAANKAQAQIEALAKELMMAGKAQQQQAAGMQVDSARLKEEVDYKMKLWSQMMKIVDQGENGKWDLAKPFREEIVEEYKEDDNPSIKNQTWRDSMPDLTINMSMPYVQVVIDQMIVFKGIKRLIIICEQKGTPVDLDQILRNAAAYPLSELYILNFGSSVTELPSSIGNFKALTALSLLNNNLKELPYAVTGLSELKVLYIDMNPVEQLLPVVSHLKKLEMLGVAKTEISASEIDMIKQVLPECKILTQ